MQWHVLNISRAEHWPFLGCTLGVLTLLRALQYLALGWTRPAADPPLSLVQACSRPPRKTSFSPPAPKPQAQVKPKTSNTNIGSQQQLSLEPSLSFYLVAVSCNHSCCNPRSLIKRLYPYECHFSRPRIDNPKHQPLAVRPPLPIAHHETVSTGAGEVNWSGAQDVRRLADKDQCGWVTH